MKCYLFCTCVVLSSVPQLESEPEVVQIGEGPEKVLFTIPGKWKWVKLENIGRWKSGGTPSRSHREYYENGTIPWLKTGDLNDGVVQSVGEYITNSGLENSSAHINPVGSVLIAMYGATIGKVGVLQFPCATNQACCACVPKESLCDQWYLFFFLLSQRKNFIALGAGGAQPNISRSKIVNSWISLPPLGEQHRIVKKINQLFAQIDCAEKAYNELSGPLSERFRQLCLEKAIQGKLVPQLESEPEVTQIGEAPEDVPFAIPEKWRWVRVSDVAHTNPKVTAQTSSTEVSFIPMAALSAGYISQIALDAKRSWGTVKNGYTKFVEGDVLLAKITPCFQNRKSAIAKKLSNGIGCGSSEFHVLRVNENIVTQEYLLMFLKSQWFITYGVENFKGTAGQQRLGTSDLKNCLFPLPPMSEQHRIVAKLNELLDSVKHLEYNVSKT